MMAEKNRSFEFYKIHSDGAYEKFQREIILG